MGNEAGRSRLKAFELVGIDDLTEPVQVWPCADCGSWHVETYRRADGTLALREWHDEHCPALAAQNREFEADNVR
jgi:hypothetical protein